MRIAFIPSRGNSKGIPKKNNLTLRGQTITDLALSLATNCEELDLVVLSTDSEEIIENCPSIANYRLDFLNQLPGSSTYVTSKIVIHKRRPEHAMDNSRTSEGIIDLISSLSLNHSDVIVLLQPTSPFRNAADLSMFIKEFENSNLKAGFSVKLVDSPHPLKSFEIQSETAQLTNVQIHVLGAPRQELARLYCPDGAFYASYVADIIRNKSLLAAQNFVYTRTGYETINIDNQMDYEFAVFLHEKGIL